MRNLKASTRSLWLQEHKSTAIGVGDFPDALVHGSTEHFIVCYQPELSYQGAAVAQQLLEWCERDYNELRRCFRGLAPSGLPFIVVLVDFANNTVPACGEGEVPRDGAYHCTCDSTIIYCDVRTRPYLDPEFTQFLSIAEIVEVFEAAQAQGWQCDFSHGEGLSRVIATSLYPRGIRGFTTASQWLDGGRPDYVNLTEHTDQNPISIGCSVLFLNYLHYQRGHSWQDIVSCAAPTLAGVYHRLTEDASDPFPTFASRLARAFPRRIRSGIETDNPFPLQPELQNGQNGSEAL